MKTFVHFTVIAATAVLIAPTFAQQPASGAKDAPQAAQAAPATPAEFEQQYAKMQDPKEREQLLQDHWKGS